MRQLFALIGLTLILVSCGDVEETLSGETLRGTNPRACLNDWDDRLLALREDKSDPERYLAETVVLVGDENANLGLAFEFLEANGWVPMSNGGDDDRLVFHPPYDEGRGIFVDFDKSEDSKFGLLVPCQAAWLSNVQLEKVYRRERGDNGAIAYEVTAP